MNSRELFTALVIQKDLLTTGDIKIIIMLNPSDKYEGDFFLGPGAGEGRGLVQ